MFHLSLLLDDCQIPPNISDSIIRWSNSSLKIFEHPAIGFACYYNKNDFIILIYEKCGVDNELLKQAELARKRQKIVFLDNFDLVHDVFDIYPGEVFLIETAAGEFGPVVRFRSGTLGVCLHYFSVLGTRMEMGWAFERVAQLYSKPTYDFHYMFRNYYKPTYSNRTPFQNISVMPRSCILYWNADGVVLQRDTLSDSSKESHIYSDKKPESQIIELIENVISSRDLCAHDVAVELSGGVDSSLVSCGLGRVLGEGIHSIGIKVHDQSLSKAQDHRRAAIINRYGFSDYYIPIELYPSRFFASSNQIDFKLPSSEHHIEAFERLWDEVREAGCLYIFTGFGGDEMFPNFLGEPKEKISIYAFDKLLKLDIDKVNRSFFTCLTDYGKDLAQSALIEPVYCEAAEISALLACQYHTHHLMRKGFWPVHPLIDSKIVEYCYHLEVTQRMGKAAGKNTLAAVLGNKSLFQNYPKENLLSAIVFSLHHYKAELQTRIPSSPLVMHGFVDPSKWYHMLEQCTRENDVISAGILAELFGLDRFMRCYQ